MRARALATLGLAVLLGGASVALLRDWISKHNQDVVERRSAPSAVTTQVVVAAAPLRFGDAIRREHLRYVDWPAGAVPDGAFQSLDKLVERQDGAARAVLRAMEPGEPVLESRITGFGAAASLSALIAPGMRATTIPVNDVNGVAGFVRPEDRVDVLLTRDAAGERRGTDLVTDIFLQDVKVLGVDQDTGPERDRPGVARAVTLEVSPLQAQKLTLAQKLGTLSLALRHVGAGDAPPRSVTIHDLEPGGRTAPAPPKATLPAGQPRTLASVAEPATAAVRVVRGLEVSDYEVASEVPELADEFAAAPFLAWPFDWRALPDKLGLGREAAAAPPRQLGPSPASGSGN